jgi:uncharacterized membrane protein YadS
VVKLTRVVLLAPLVAGVALAARRHRRPATLSPVAEDAPVDRLPPILPLFVVGFLAAIVVRSTGVLSEGGLDAAATLEKVLLTVALAAMGLGVNIGRMRRLGARPLALGLVAWVLVAGTAYAGTLVVGA